MTQLERIFITKDGMDKNEAKEYLNELRNRVLEGENPEEVLYDEGLEPDYIFDLITF